MQSDAPGLKAMTRRTKSGSRTDYYWVADSRLVKQGYTPKVVRLFHGTHDERAARCRILWAEMLEWKRGGIASSTPHGRGSLGWLIHDFLSDPESPFRQTRDATQKFYARYGNIITESVGKRPIADLTGRDIRRWHTNWKERIGSRQALACIQVLRRCASYGAGELAHDSCMRLKTILENMRFETPRRRTARATAEQIEALIDEATRAGYPSIGLATMIQFELVLRQKDVIGEWTRIKDGSRDGITNHGWRWQWGLTWSHIDKDWIVRKPLSKSNGARIAEHDIKRAPALLARLQAVPLDRRIGPVIISEGTDNPWKPETFRHRFRRIATAAGWPTDLWSMDSRAGGITEAYEGGADIRDAMAAAQHTELKTSLGYRRATVDQSARVMDIRHARRTRGKHHE